MTRAERVRLGLLAAAIVVSLLAWFPKGIELSLTEAACECLKISILDVGQGDSILIESPAGHQALIDGGVDSAVLRRLGEELSFFDRTLDLVVSTHPDADHVGGLVSVLKRYQVASILQTENGKDTPVVKAYTAAANAEGVTITEADAGQVITLGDSVKLRVLSPTGDESNWESNAASIVIHVEYGSTSVMLTGDAPQEIENYLVATYPQYLKSDILKLGHHGSKTSSSEEFITAVAPTYAVVSAAVGNRYGHPHQEVMQRVFTHNIQTSHTGTDGTVTFYSDGKTVWRK